MEPLFEVCDSANVASASSSSPAYGTCSNPYWVPQPQLFPYLSMTDGAAIACAIGGIWAVAYMVRALRLKD